jgi:hypothetical protein
VNGADEVDMTTGDSPAAIARTLLGRPDLWWTGVRVLWRLTPPHWWRGGSHLPLPHDAWWRFRMVTAYGRPDARPRSRDVIGYLEWCRSTGSRGSRSHRRRPGEPPERLDVRRSG